MQWIDDTLIYAEAEEQYLDNLELLLNKMIKFKLSLSVKKWFLLPRKLNFSDALSK